MIADYTNALADKFNTFYNAYPVIKADSTTTQGRTNRPNKSNPNCPAKRPLNLIGVTAPEKM